MAEVDGGQGDSIDAKGIFGKLLPTKTVDPISIVGSITRDEYFKFPKRGKCYIFNHKQFEPHTNLNTRNGTDADAGRLYCRFRELGYETEVFPDLSVREVNAKLCEVGKEDHSDHSSFVCCILSHGEYGILYAKDGKYPTESVFAPFRGDVCPSLVGKPKLFFIQACQGDKLDHGVEVITNEALDAASHYKIPTHADFLIMYSTVPGFYSWRNTTDGSWFIQALCEALKDYAGKKDLLQILTVVNRKVAFEFESRTPQDHSMNQKKQVPLITSTLTRDVRFS